MDDGDNRLVVEGRPLGESDAAMPTVFAGERLHGLEKYLFDESRRGGHADAVALPNSLAHVRAVVSWAARQKLPVTVSGARTGIAGGAVPEGGLVVSLERMNRFLGLRRTADDRMLLACQAGTTLEEIRQAVATGAFPDAANWDDKARNLARQLQASKWFFPPDPTETTASIGGMVACNASGAHTFRYGPTRSYVHALTVVLADGGVLKLERGRVAADAQGRFVLAGESGDVNFHVPRYAQPRTKNAGGYFSGPRLDAVDVLIGSEGTLGIVAEVEIVLVPAPESLSAQVVFWPDESTALAFVQRLRDERRELGVEAIEYVDLGALALLRQRRVELGAASGVPPDIPQAATCGVYLDLGLDATRLPAALARLAELILERGGNLAETWSAHAKSERETLRRFRHALPEAVNAQVATIRQKHPTVTKLGTDMAVPDDCLERIMRLYRRELGQSGLDYVIFGHIGDNHLHVNILPQTPEDYAVGQALYLKLARAVVDMGGSPVAEHGVGKLKTALLEMLVGAQGLAQMRAVKQAFDPQGRLSPGNLFGKRSG